MVGINYRQVYGCILKNHSISIPTKKVKGLDMPAQKRFPTDYPGVYFIEGTGAPNSGHKVERIYYIDYRINGKRIQEKAGRQYKDNMTAAKANQIRTSKIEGRTIPNAERRAKEKAEKEAEDNRWTIAKLWDLYCDTFPDNKALRNEQNKFNRYLRHDIGKMEGHALSPLDIDRLRITLKKEGKLTTAARILELLRRTLNFGVKRGLISAISFKVEIPRLNNQTTEDLSSEQLSQLLDAIDNTVDQTAANIMRIALFTGMRRNEIFKLEWRDIDFEKGFITLRDPKGKKDQKIPLNEKTREVLQRIKSTNKSVFVFPGLIKGQHMVECKGIKHIAKAAGLPEGFRPLHGLRHLYASMLASSGQVDLYTLQKLLTHKSPQMTQRYAHLRDDALKKASGVVDDILGAVTTERDKLNKKNIVNIDDHIKSK